MDALVQGLGDVGEEVRVAMVALLQLLHHLLCRLADLPPGQRPVPGHHDCAHDHDLPGKLLKDGGHLHHVPLLVRLALIPLLINHLD